MRVIALTLAGFLTATVLTADVTGTWKVAGDVAGNPVIPTLTLTQDGASLSGTAEMPGVSSSAPVTGTVKDRAVTFAFDVEHEGTVYTLTFDGVINEDGVLKGGIDVQGMASGQFTATRQ
jgi:hypothetical protein